MDVRTSLSGRKKRRTVFDEQVSAVKLTLGESDRDHFRFCRFEIDICKPSRTWSHSVLIDARENGKGKGKEECNTPHVLV